MNSDCFSVKVFIKNLILCNGVIKMPVYSNKAAFENEEKLNCFQKGFKLYSSHPKVRKLQEELAVDIKNSAMKMWVTTEDGDHSSFV